MEAVSVFRLGGEAATPFRAAPAPQAALPHLHNEVRVPKPKFGGKPANVPASLDDEWEEF